MPVNHVKKYLISIHTCLVFLPFLARALYAPSIPILERNVPNLVQGLLRTCYLLIWVWQLDLQETKLHYFTIYIYHDFFSFSKTNASLLKYSNVTSEKYRPPCYITAGYMDPNIPGALAMRPKLSTNPELEIGFCQN